MSYCCELDNKSGQRRLEKVLLRPESNSRWTANNPSCVEFTWLRVHSQSPLVRPVPLEECTAPLLANINIAKMGNQDSPTMYMMWVSWLPSLTGGEPCYSGQQSVLALFLAYTLSCDASTISLFSHPSLWNLYFHDYLIGSLHVNDLLDHNQEKHSSLQKAVSKHGRQEKKGQCH